MADAKYIVAAQPSMTLNLIQRLERAEEARQETQRNEQAAIEARNRAADDARKLLAALHVVDTEGEWQGVDWAIPAASWRKAHAAIANAEQKGGV